MERNITQYDQIDITDADGKVNEDAVKCYLCKFTYPSYSYARKRFNYCPGCGAEIMYWKAKGKNAEKIFYR